MGTFVPKLGTFREFLRGLGQFLKFFGERGRFFLTFEAVDGPRRFFAVMLTNFRENRKKLLEIQ